MNTVSYTWNDWREFSFLLPEFQTPMITETNCCSENGIATVAVKLLVCCAFYNVV